MPTAHIAWSVFLLLPLEVCEALHYFTGDECMLAFDYYESFHQNHARSRRSAWNKCYSQNDTWIQWSKTRICFRKMVIWGIWTQAEPAHEFWYSRQCKLWRKSTFIFSSRSAVRTTACRQTRLQCETSGFCKFDLTWIKKSSFANDFVPLSQATFF